MKFTVANSTLLSCLQMAGKVVAPNNLVPILENFLVVIEDNKLTVTGSNLENSITSSIEIESTGSNLTIALPARLIIDTLRTFPDEPIEFNINEDNMEVVIRSSSAEYNFIGLRGNDFPQTIDLDSSCNSFTAPANVLLTGISKTITSTAIDDIRPTMTGINITIDSAQLTFVATDAHKLTRYAYKDIKSDDAKSFILPKKTALLLKNIISPNDSSEISITFDDKNVIFRNSVFSLVCRQVEGKFPNCNSVIPKNNPFEMIIDKESLRNSIRRIMVFANTSTYLIKMHIAGNLLEITTQDVDTGRSGREQISCQYNGDELNIGFRAPQVADILSSIDSENVKIHLADASRAAIFLPFETTENEELLNLVMPMLIN
ncbi:MAG: DNA polymerase III subunit beta [Paludibacteraceae bacterium]|nr:DNA polymerase III subunit beta [Paludibacteraceae bacterium]